ncbi:MAG TPA: hypothetical protein VGG02_11380 [Chthoniobacterales bacterium]|jgi:hypothetical protein
MNNISSIVNAILWSAAIIAAALLHAPNGLTIAILPALAVGSLILVNRRPANSACRQSR